MLEKYNKNWDKVINIINNGFGSGPVYNNKYLKTEIKSYEGKVNTIFHNDKMSADGSHIIYLSVVIIDSVFKMGKNYYPQLFLGDCKYIVKEKKWLNILMKNLNFLLIQMNLMKNKL